MFSGINPEGRNSSKVLRPPGGGSSLGPFHVANGEQVAAESVVPEKPVEAPSDPVPAEASVPVEETSEEAACPPAVEQASAEEELSVAPAEAVETPVAPVAGV